MILIILLSGSQIVWGFRSKKPPTFTNLNDNNQLSELNTILSDFWDITNGRYTLENLNTDPNGTRKGQKGDLVYATFGGNDHLCVNTDFPIGTNWTCVNVGTLETCPGGADGMVQFNDNGNCGGDIDFTWDKNINDLIIGNSTNDDADVMINGRAAIGSTSTTDEDIVLHIKDPQVSTETVIGLEVSVNHLNNTLNDDVWAGLFDSRVAIGRGADGIFPCNRDALLCITETQSALTSINREELTFYSEPRTITLSSGAAISNFRNNLFASPLFVGTSGSPTETIDTASTVEISGRPQPHGSGLMTIGERWALNVRGSSADSNRSLSRWEGNTVFEFEGATDNSAETFLVITEPTADRTITIPNATGNICLEGPSYDCTLANATVTGTVVIYDQATVTGSVVTWNTITSERTTDLGWSIQTAANQACTTTCTYAAVFGQDTDTANGPIVGPSDATADRCLCAGAN